MKTGLILNLDEFADGAPLRVDKDGKPSCEDIELAVFLLLGEASDADGELAVAEVREIVDVMAEEFGHSEAGVLKLSELAHQISTDPARIIELLNTLKDKFTTAQRTWAFSLAWRVILADGIIKKSEKATAERLANNLGLTEQEREQAIELAKAKTLPEGFIPKEEM